MCSQGSDSLLQKAWVKGLWEREQCRDRDRLQDTCTNGLQLLIWLLHRSNDYSLLHATHYLPPPWTYPGVRWGQQSCKPLSCWQNPHYSSRLLAIPLLMLLERIPAMSHLHGHPTTWGAVEPGQVWFELGLSEPRWSGRISPSVCRRVFLAIFHTELCNYSRRRQVTW